MLMVLFAGLGNTEKLVIVDSWVDNISLLISYTRTWPEVFPLSSLPIALIVKILPSEDKSTLAPKASFSISPVKVFPICTQFSDWFWKICTWPKESSL